MARFAAPILPGQSQVISVPGPSGAPQQALRIRRFANRLGAVVVEVERVSIPSVGAQAVPPVLSGYRP